MSGAGDVVIRDATPADAAIIAAHRVAMFQDMGRLAAGRDAEALAAAARAYLSGALAGGEYRAWLAFAPGAAGGPPVAGAGVLLRVAFPGVLPAGGVSEHPAREALLLNVYTVPAWRRRGVAERLVREATAWARGQGVASVRLHASDAGRALYARLGYVATNEMVFRPPAGPPTASA